MTLAQRLRRNIKEMVGRAARDPCVYLNRGIAEMDGWMDRWMDR